MRPPMVQFVLILGIASGLVLSAAPVTWALDGPKPLQQGETMGGGFSIWIGEFVGGLLGGGLGVQSVEQALSYYCRDADDPEQCKRYGRVIVRPISYPIAISVWATSGILTVGLLGGTVGNIGATFIGSFAGAIAGLVEAAGLWTIILQPLLEPGRVEEMLSPETPPIAKRALPLFVEFLRTHEGVIKDMVYVALPVINAAFWGTIGFNSGAQAVRGP